MTRQSVQVSVPESAAAIADIMAAAGVPTGVYTNLRATHDQVSHLLIEDPRVRGISLTGSERAVAAVAAQAGAALKNVVLELGGSDPYVVLSAQDIPAAVAAAVQTRLENTGQACNSNKRIIVHADIYEDFVAEAVRVVSQLQPRPPAEITDGVGQRFFGPMSSAGAAEKIVAQIEAAVAAGATVHTGGQRLDGPWASGFYVSPAVLTDVPVGSEVYYEEFFGPVVTIFRAADDAEALRLANNTPYGLGASVFADQPGRAEAFGEHLQAGMVGINGEVPMTEETPFGGVKSSGYGRELGELGMEEFVNKRVICVHK
ncbi:aldehyde dehydrogenase family protein [Corynebacterium heidelbergense]|nr:aldehyde dehydrogenase family protein [Corynebacterium heidelbergense]WCZ36796.1 Succinate-semialdehyde dehydrogenase [NADP(+)] 1 [Corynebacterium heidelbergense]